MEIHLTDNKQQLSTHLFLLLGHLRRNLGLLLLLLFQEQGSRRLGNVFQKIQRQEVALMQRQRQEHLPK